MDPWIESTAARLAERAERELEALVAVSSPSGDIRGAEEVIAVASALLPQGAAVERPPCSSPGHAPDLLATLRGRGARRLLLLGHVDTVVAHGEHRRLERRGPRLTGSGAVDMKGGVALALALLETLAELSDAYAEAALLLVCDEEWRTADFAHAGRFADFDACLCFEAGQLGPEGEEAVIVRRKAAGTLRIEARGLSAHSGSAPDRGRNALLALAAAAERVAGCHAPAGPERLSAVPTVMHSGDAFNVVPAAGELYCDLRADRLAAFEPVLAAIPAEVGGATLEARLVRRWPGMDARVATADLLAGAGRRLGRPAIAAERGGASDASHVAANVPLTVDGLGPRGGGAHTPEEYVLAESLRSRAAVALAVGAALFALGVERGLALVAAIASALVVGSVAVEYYRGVRARQRGGQALLPALATLVARNRRRYGGYLVHLAMVLIAVGVLGSGHQVERLVTLGPGESASVGPYTLTYGGLYAYRQPGMEAAFARLELDGPPGQRLATLEPDRRVFRNWEQQPVSGIAIETTWPWLDDVYVVLVEADAIRRNAATEGSDAANRATFHVFVNPLVLCIWLGGWLFLLGTLVAAWPEARPRPVGVRAAPPAREVVVSEA